MALIPAVAAVLLSYIVLLQAAPFDNAGAPDRRQRSWPRRVLAMERAPVPGPKSMMHDANDFELL